MEKETSIAVFSPELQNTPGWAALARDKQDWLLEHTSNILQYRRMEGLSAVAASKELAEIQIALEGGPIKMKHYIRSVFGASERTAWRRLADFKELRKYWSDNMIEMIASKGATLLKGASGIHMGSLLKVARLAPTAPKSKDDKVIEAYITKDLRDAIKDTRSAARTGKVVKITGEDAAKMAFNSVVRVMRGVKLATSAEKRKWLTTVVGWVMEYNAISGTMRVGRIAIPDGTIAKVGRPRGSTRKKKAA